MFKAGQKQNYKIILKKKYKNSKKMERFDFNKKKKIKKINPLQYILNVLKIFAMNTISME